MIAICANASRLLPSTLPASRVRAGSVDSRISTTLVCFSCTTLCAIVEPKVVAETKKTIPKPIATR